MFYTLMLRKLLFAAFLLFISQLVSAQCATEAWSLETRIKLSQVIVEGKVIRQYPFREVGTNNIYTASEIEVYKVFKGQPSNPEIIEVITFGGTIGLERHQASPELELMLGDMGVFFLNNNLCKLPDAVKNNGKSHFKGTANTLSFVAYDLDENQVFDHEQIFQGIETTFYETVTNFTKQPFISVKSSGYNPERLKFKATASPVISGYATGNANGGTGDVITVIGKGFGTARGNGRVEFFDANYGDGRRMKTPYANDYSVWNDTMIKVRIPSRAGTGTIKVATNDSASTIFNTAFKINYSHLNVNYKPTGGNEQYYTTDHINDNNKGGYTFQMNPRFKANTGMVNALLRGMETWRCGTFMNWEIGNDTAINVTASDKVNIVRITKFTDNTLAVCYTYWAGCIVSGTNMEWFVTELDIEADSSRKWYYGVDKPASNEYDFQSVITHELGHGHQLAHVIASNEMMHYSISNGQRKADLSANDMNGGLYVKDKSIKINVCSGPKMIALNTNNCNYTKPLTGFSANTLKTCPQQNVTFTDSTKGLVKGYFWNFGADATPQTANTKGPHTVTYSTDGLKTVRLIASNDFGYDTITKTAYINILPAKPNAPTNLKYVDTACLAATIISVDTLKEGTLTWQLPSQATELSGTINSKRISWTQAGGPFTFWVKATNLCGSSDSIIGKVVVLNNPTVGFTFLENGRSVTFTNTSQFAQSYRWLFGDGDSSKAANPVHLYPMGKAYTATLYSINRCKTVSTAKTVNPFHPAAIEIPLADALFSPNPAQSQIIVSDRISNTVIINALGQIVLTSSASTIDISCLSNGIYHLQLTGRNGKTYDQTLLKTN